MLLSYALIVAHLIGDYVLQSHTMAIRKTKDLRWALLHAFFYSLPFLPILLLYSHQRHVDAYLTILLTHALIDRYALARRWCVWYGVGFPGFWWDQQPTCTLDHGAGPFPHPADSVPECKADPDTVFTPPPDYIGGWLIILVDNTLHLCINGFAIWITL